MNTPPALQVQSVFWPAKAARLSDCGRYRYELMRQVAPGNARVVTWIMLNPSTADAERDDPTIRKCMGFTRQWGAGWMRVVNLFAWRATSPVAMRVAADPVGADNDKVILDACRAPDNDKVVCAWGAHGGFRGRDAEVLRMLAHMPLHVLRLTKDGAPGHPLYIPYSAPLGLWHRAEQQWGRATCG